MAQEYDRSAVLQGSQLKRELEEKPTVPAMISGQDDPLTTDNLASTNTVRKAGPGGVHALNLATNPEAQARTNNWMTLFGQSNEGMAFNEAKMIEAENAVMAGVNPEKDLTQGA